MVAVGAVAFGAGVYFGYTKNVSIAFAEEIAVQITSLMTITFNFAGYAFEIASKKADPVNGVTITAVGDKETYFPRP